eukprot:TRINITY_DN45252_c0_g1_i1.p1 TRINITY_DN45252_c0_g1~~TRINITY_DN45252_c0_g1_i1.p1  ORF type:complete len:1301 (-),score=299.14 TRINITY_DN45252_c0_g1_i1:75-3977(-)
MRNIVSVRLLGLLGLLLLLATTGVNGQQKFAFGTLQWSQVVGGSGGTVSFTIQTAWSSSAFTNATVGNTVYESGTSFKPSNDGTSTATSPLALYVTSVSTGGWFTATTTLTYSYSANGLYTAYIYSGSSQRFSSLANNPSGPYAVQSIVWFNSGQSRKSIQVSASVKMSFNLTSTTQQFSLPVSNFNSELLRYRVSTAQEAGGSSQVYTQVPNLNVDFNTGTVTFLANTKALYSFQLMVVGYDSSVRSSNPPTTVGDTTGIVTNTAVDYLLNVDLFTTNTVCSRFCTTKGSVCSTSSPCSGCSGGSNYCRTNYAPYFSSFVVSGVDRTSSISSVQTGASYTFAVGTAIGKAFNYTLVANDLNTDDYVNISSGSIPSGASQTISSNANSTTIVFKWTPGVNDSGTIVCYTATDAVGTSNAGQLCIRVYVTVGSLSATGAGLTSAVAGSTVTTVVINALSSLISFKISSGTSVVSTANVTCQTPPCSNSSQSAYSTAYIAPTATGFYVVNISEWNTGLNTILTSLTVSPYPVTDPTQTSIFDYGTQGLTGGFPGNTLTSYITARDKYGNEQTTRGNDDFYVVVCGPGNICKTYGSSYISGGKYSFSYQVPSLNGATVDTAYNLSVYYNSSSAGMNVFVKKFTTVVAKYTSFGVDRSPQTLKFRVGDHISFTLTPKDSAANSSSLVFAVSMLINQWATTPDQCSATLAGGLKQLVSDPVVSVNSTTSTYYVVSSNVLQVNSFVNLGISYTTLGMSGNTTTVSYDVTTGDLVPTNSRFCGSLWEFPAGGTNSIKVYLRDIYSNTIGLGPYQVYFNYTVTSNGVSYFRQGYASNNSLDSSFAISITSTYSGSFTLYVEAVNTTNIPLGYSISGVTISSPFSGIIKPANFSATQSTLSGDRFFTAGNSKSLIVTAKDQYGNLRSDVADTDRFIFQANCSLNNGDIIVPMTISSPTTTNGLGTYTFTLSQTKACSYQMYFYYYSARDQAFAPFVAGSSDVIVVYAGPVALPNPQNDTHNIAGNGKATGVQGTLTYLQVQMKDLYGNIVENDRNGYIILNINYQGSQTQYAGWYCIGTDSCPKVLPRAILKTEITDPSVTNLTAEDSQYVAQGFWKCPYIVPTIAQNGVQTFTIEVWYGNYSTYIPGTDFNTLKSMMTQIYSGNAHVDYSGATATISPLEDNWQAVAIGIIVGSVFLTLVMYGAWRLTRYRTKYVIERKRAEKAERELVEIGREVDVIPNKDWGTGDDNLTTNPLLNMQKPGTTDPKKDKDQVDDPDINMKKDRGAIRQEFRPNVPTLRGHTSGGPDI